MADEARLQVRSTASQLPWADVGHNLTDQKLPVQLYDSSGNLITTLPVSVSGLPSIGSYQVNHLDDGSTTPNVLYIGMEKDDGTYAIKKLDETDSTLPVVTYATIGDNPSRTTYTLAWTNRATLSFGLYSVAF